MSGPERHDHEAERAVLAEALLAPELLPQLLARISTGDFHDPRNALVWAAAVSVHERGEPVDVRTLATELQAARSLQALGGAQYLGDLTDEVPTVAHWEAHVSLVLACSRARQVRAALERGLHALDSEAPPAEATAKALAQVGSLRDVERGPDCKPVADHAAALWEIVETACDKGSPAAKTGLRCLDGDGEDPGLTAGLFPGRLWVIAAPTSGGKSAFAAQIAEHVAAQEKPVLYVSQEMPGPELLARLAGSRAGVPAFRALAGRFGVGEMERFAAELEGLCRLPLEIMDSGTATPAQIRAQALRVKAERGSLGLVVVDYLQILRPDRHYDSEVRQIEEQTRAMKALALETGAPVMLLSQFNRSPETQGRRPRKSDLRGSGSIENDADLIVFLHADPPGKDEDGKQLPRQNREKVTLLLEKQRGGPTGEAKLIFDRPATRFEDDNGQDDGEEAREWGPPR